MLFRSLERVRDAKVKKIGIDHPSTLITRRNSAEAYLAAGKFPQAIDVFEQVWKAQVDKLGADHPQSLSTLTGLAEAYREAGKLPEAVTHAAIGPELARTLTSEVMAGMTET